MDYFIRLMSCDGTIPPERQIWRLLVPNRIQARFHAQAKVRSVRPWEDRIA